MKPWPVQDRQRRWEWETGQEHPQNTELVLGDETDLVLVISHYSVILLIEFSTLFLAFGVWEGFHFIPFHKSLHTNKPTGTDSYTGSGTWSNPTHGSVSGMNVASGKCSIKDINVGSCTWTLHSLAVKIKVVLKFLRW